MESSWLLLCQSIPMDDGGGLIASALHGQYNGLTLVVLLY